MLLNLFIFFFFFAGSHQRHEVAGQRAAHRGGLLAGDRPLEAGVGAGCPSSSQPWGFTPTPCL